MKGIILAGGSGTRLYPATFAISKQLIPIYDKPMIYYSLSTLMLAGIKDILLISTPQHIDLYKTLLKTGEQFGISLKYKEQKMPKGIAEAFILGEKFIGKESICLALGDNIFYGENLIIQLRKAATLKKGAIVFAHPVQNPKDYGVVEFNKKNEPISIEEKPQEPKSNFVISGLYFYDNKVSKIAQKIKPSTRGELEISDINKIYLAQKKLIIYKMGRGIAWLDTGTPENLQEASNFIKTIETRQGFKIACLEEIAFNNGWVSNQQLLRSAKRHRNSKYGEYLNLVAQKIN